MDQLTAKQQKFVDEYLVDLNATQAAMRAGYEWGLGSGFYVYFLTNPINGSVFYIGKGCGKRAQSHLRGAERRPNAFKEIEIRKIRASRREPVIQYFASGLSEPDALTIEGLMINALRKFGLTNIVNGSRSATEACRVEAEEMLDRMKPYDLWESGLTPMQRRSTVIVGGGPRGAYDKIRAALLTLIERPLSEQWITTHAV
jgi:hypothetical protein